MQSFNLLVLILSAYTFLFSALPAMAAPLNGVNRDLAPIANLAAREGCPSGETYGCRLTFRDTSHDPSTGEAVIATRPRYEQGSLKATGQECGCFAATELR